MEAVTVSALTATGAIPVEIAAHPGCGRPQFKPFLCLQAFVPISPTTLLWDLVSVLGCTTFACFC